MAQVRTVSQPDPLPGWLIGRLNNIAWYGAHYESSFGGLHNALLNSYFFTTA